MTHPAFEISTHNAPDEATRALWAALASHAQATLDAVAYMESGHSKGIHGSYLQATLNRELHCTGWHLARSERETSTARWLVHNLLAHPLLGLAEWLHNVTAPSEVRA